MKPNPTLVNGIRQCLFVLVRDESACMPTCASVEHVEDTAFVDEQKIALDLIVKGVGKIHTAYVVWAWRGPHAAHLTGVTDFWNQIEDCVRDSNSFEEAAHHGGRSVPPSHMQLSQCATVGTYSACPEEPDHSANIKVGPV